MKSHLLFLSILLTAAGCVPSGSTPDPAIGKDLTSFSLVAPCVSGTIDQDAGTVSVEVPARTDVTALVAQFATTGILVTVDGTEQVSGETANDFTHPVEYVVTAEDGSSSTYVISVVVASALSSDKAITAFSFHEPAATGQIDEASHTIRAIVPHGTDVSSLVAVYTATGVSVTVDDTAQESGVSVNDFTDPLAYVVAAQDGTTTSYVVTVTPAPSTEKAITSFSLQAPTAAGVIDQDARIIRARVPEGTDLASLVAVYSTTGASVSVAGREQESGVTANDFTLPLDYIVTAEDGSTAVYNVRVTGRIGLVINELDIDQVGADTAEFIELYAAAETDMTGIVIVQINGGVTPGQEYARIDLAPVGVMAAGSYLVCAGSGVTVPEAALKYTPKGWESSNRIQNGPSDALILFDIIGARVIDTVAYAGVLHRAVISGQPGEWDATEGGAGAPADSNSSTGSIGRSPNGQDTGQNGADFKFSATLTPGSPNP